MDGNTQYKYLNKPIWPDFIESHGTVLYPGQLEYRHKIKKQMYYKLQQYITDWIAIDGCDLYEVESCGIIMTNITR